MRRFFLVMLVFGFSIFAPAQIGIDLQKQELIVPKVDAGPASGMFAIYSEDGKTVSVTLDHDYAIKLYRTSSVPPTPGPCIPSVKKGGYGVISQTGGFAYLCVPDGQIPNGTYKWVRFPVEDKW
jgi:hypothetical protein